MQIAIYNQKGGAGKTMLATQIALYYDATIFELDPYGVLTQTLNEDRVVKLNLEDSIPTIEDGDVVYDFGGFDDERLDSLKDLDLIIIPFQPTINSLGTTVKSFFRVYKMNIPILFVVNGYMKEDDVEDAVEFLLEQLAIDVQFASIPHTRALQTAENSSVSVIELANSGGLKGHTYKKIGMLFQDLFSKIDKLVEFNKIGK